MARKKGNDNTENWSHKNDFPIEEIWSTNHVLARLIVPRLQAFKELDKHGGPADFKNMHEWNKAIQKMIDAFELMKYAGASHTKEEQLTVEDGLDLFRKYFQNLWD